MSQVRLEQPQFLIDAAKQHGVTIDKYVDFDAKRPIEAVQSQFAGEEPDFGCCGGEFGCDSSHGREYYPTPPAFTGEAQFGSFLKHIIGRKADRKLSKTVGGALKAVGKVGAVASFAIPGVGPLVGTASVAAMAAADKTLGGMNKKQRAKLISNTKAMAAMGDPHAKRGALVLATVDQIRKAKKVPPGKPAITAPGPVQLKSYIKIIPQVKVQAMARTAPISAHLTWWARFKNFILMRKVKPSGTTKPIARPRAA